MGLRIHLKWSDGAFLWRPLRGSQPAPSIYLSLHPILLLPASCTLLLLDCPHFWAE